VIVTGSGHWLMEEKTEETIAAVTRALEEPATAQK
jgi:pimeloyl-ACP methyl ester carboxylesterase